MASLGLTPEELKAVEQTRQRLSQLSSSINSLKNDVFVSNPLPSIDSLQASADILNLNLQAIVDSLAQNNELFSRIVVHPSTNFPGRTQENVLLQLLRKKAEPDVEVYMDKGRQTLANLPVPPEAALGEDSNNTINQEKAKEKALEDVWSQNRDTCGVRIAEYVMNEEGDFFTAEERAMGIENVRTGLRQTFDDEEDESDDEDEEDEGEGEDKGAAAHIDADIMIIDRPPPPPAPAIRTSQTPGTTVEILMRLATRGQLTG